MSSITREEVLKMDLKSIHAAVKDPKTAADMQQLLRDRQVVSRISELMLDAQNREAEVDAQVARTIPPSTEELAAQAQAMVEEPAVVQPAVVVPPVVSAEPEKKKIVREYQVRDEDGTPIGRPTHLEAWSIEEMLEKMQTAHENATRAFHRLKKQKLTFKQETKLILTPEQIAEAAKVALEEKNPDKVRDVITATIETEFGKRDHELREKEAFNAGVAISNEFMRRHLHDYNPCEANQKEMGIYFNEKNLEFTLDNLEAAFIDLTDQKKLVKVETFTTRQAAPDANPPVVASTTAPATEIPATVQPVADTASVVPQPTVPSQPVAEITVTTPAGVPNAQPPARRPGVNGAIAPGTLSAQRPGTPDPALARKEFLKTVREMKPEVMKAKLKNDPQFVKQLESYGIRVR